MRLEVFAHDEMHFDQGEDDCLSHLGSLVFVALQGNKNTLLKTQRARACLH
jgi:hypothetical protein